MPEWLRELGWFSRVGPAVIAILPILAAASLSAFLTTWLQERRRVRREHLAAIKADVFCPLRRELEGFYLPLLSGRRGPVTVEQVGTSGRDAGAHLLTPLTTPGQLQLCGTRPVETGDLDRGLYTDAKCRHYSRFFRRLERFKSEVDAYTRMWAHHAEQVSQALLEQSGLPLVTEADPLSDAGWIDSPGLALFVVNRQLGLAQRPLCLGPDGRSIEVGGVTMAHAPAEDPIQRSLKVLEVLANKRETPDELRLQAEPLLQLAKSLLRDLDRLRVSSELPGGCRLAGL